MEWERIKEYLKESSQEKSLWRGLLLLWSIAVLSYLLKNEEAPGLINPLWVVSHGIHELGHWTTSFFGDWVSVACGSLFQFVFPFIFIAAFVRQKDLHAAFLLCTWQGANCLHMAHYAGSAEYADPIMTTLWGQELYHDWVWMLSRLNAIHRARDVEDIFFAMAITFTVISIIGQIGCLYLFKKNGDQMIAVRKMK